ncbi:MAG: hypothetical protein P4L85_14055 [Paludisphaera borealis]|uniref:hypothetical protein n=1 Tax=Paludisphaera borealis TaxID=1387353 RepID=UPI00284129AB|nr:hypothetical protein [Paludisphaera borealis]MDR3620470.1 hypothetical protein [Paludisphaera borealis]
MHATILIAVVMTAQSFGGGLGGVGGRPGAGREKAEDCYCTTLAEQKPLLEARLKSTLEAISDKFLDAMKIFSTVADGPKAADMPDLTARASKLRDEINAAAASRDKLQDALKQTDELLKAHDKAYGPGVRHKGPAPARKGATGRTR